MNPEQQRFYDIGWDFAMYGRCPPDSANTPFHHGFRAWGHRQRRKPKRPDRFTRKWLQIRYNAAMRQKPFDDMVDPVYLRAILPDDQLCPVTRQPLTFGELQSTDWSIERADNAVGYIRGNVIVISVRANKAKGAKTLDQLYARAIGQVHDDTLSVKEWGRLHDLVEPMHPSEHGVVKGVHVLLGQRVAPGAPVGPVARLQYLLQDAVILTIQHPQMQFLADTIITRLYQRLCHTKAEARALRRLVLCVYKRARTGTFSDKLWSTPKIRKVTTLFIDELHRNGARHDIEEVLTEISQEFYEVPDSIGETFANHLRRLPGRF